MHATAFHARHLATVIFSLLILAAFSVPANAAVLDVPAQYATIGAAVTAASSGDTIVLAPGTYNAAGDLNLTITKSLTFEASGTAANTVIDCDGEDSFIEELNSNNLNLTFQNLTFQDTEETVFDFDDSSGDTFTFNGCVFTGLTGSAAVTTVNANTVNVTDCTMDNNSAQLFELELGTLTVSDSSFVRDSNIALGVNETIGTVSNCTFADDGSSNGNGPVDWLNASLTMTDCTFTDNISFGGGGAITIDSAGLDTPVTLNRCLFSGNSTVGNQYGGGCVLMFEGDHNIPFTAKDCVFVDNTSSIDGAVIAGFIGDGAGSMTFTNCSFYGNSYTGGSVSGQGTIAATSNTPLTITNSILYGDTTPNEISTNNPAESTTVSSSDIHQSGYNGADGNINADPKYAGAAGDLHIPMSSPCAGTGTTTGASSVDFSQYDWGTIVSMGAFSPIQLSFLTPTNATTGTSFSFSVTALAFDGSTTITNFADTLHFTSSDASASLPADSTLTNGTGTFNATLNTTGNQTITATDTSTSAITGTSANVAVSGPATHFVVSAPATVVSYGTYSLTVTAEDAEGNVATGYTGTVHFTSTDPSAVLPADSTLTNGVGSFNFALKTAGVQTITATDTVNSSITGTSNDITVMPGVAVRLVISAPAAATKGSSFSFRVTAQDLFGNTATGYSGTVHFTSTDGLATLPVDSTLTNGVGQFNATLNTIGDQTITAIDAVTSSITGTSGAIDVMSPALTTFPAGLQMISAPSDYSAFTVSQIFSPTGAKLAVWQTVSGSYAITPTAPADTIRPGQGYWALFTTATSLLDIGQHVNETQPFRITLQKGWNMIGDPFAVNVPLSRIQVVVNGIQKPFPGATWLRPVVMDQLYTYPAGATQYQTETSELRTYLGYWLYAYQDCTLVIPSPPI